MTARATAQDFFQVKRHEDVAIVVPSPEIETLPESLMADGGRIVLASLKEDPPSHLIVDLDGVRYFGSAFIAFMLRCHVPVKQQGGELVLASVSDGIRDLMRTTALDTIWPIYGTRQEALDVLAGSE